MYKHFQMEKLSELLAHRRIPGEYLTKKIEALQQLDCEIQAEPTVQQVKVNNTVQKLINKHLNNIWYQIMSEVTVKVTNHR